MLASARRRFAPAGLALAVFRFNSDPDLSFTLPARIDALRARAG